MQELTSSWNQGKWRRSRATTSKIKFDLMEVGQESALTGEEIFLQLAAAAVRAENAQRYEKGLTYDNVCSF